MIWASVNIISEELVLIYSSYLEKMWDTISSGTTEEELWYNHGLVFQGFVDIMPKSKVIYNLGVELFDLRIHSFLFSDFFL